MADNTDAVRRACDHCRADYTPRRRTGGRFTVFCSLRCAAQHQKHARREENQVGKYGRVCTSCRIWHPWSAHAPASKSRTYEHDRSPRCFWCRYQSAHHSNHKTVVRHMRACLEPQGFSVCGTCNEIVRIGDLMSGVRGERGQRTCTYCVRANTLRAKGVVVDGVTLRMAWDRQGGACAVCESSMTLTRHTRISAHAHHCHTTLRFLDWLCADCNAAEGFLRGEVRRALAMAEYMAATNGGTPKDAPTIHAA